MTWTLFLLVGPAYAQQPLGAYMETQATHVMAKYEFLLVGMAAHKRTPKQALDWCDSLIPLLFDTTRTVLYDDIYLQDRHERYFLPRAYFMTLLSWYPNGAAVKMSDLKWTQLWYHEASQSMIAEGSFLRIVSGLNYNGLEIRDTLRQYATVQVELLFPEASPHVQILLISPVPLTEAIPQTARVPFSIPQPNSSKVPEMRRLNVFENMEAVQKTLLQIDSIRTRHKKRNNIHLLSPDSQQR